MKNKYVYLLLTLVISVKNFGQQENLYYKKGLEVVLDSLILENPKIKFFLGSEYPIFDTSKDPFGGFNCNINFDDLNQHSLNTIKIIIPNKYQNRLKRNNLFNRLIYGDKLVEIIVDVLYEASNNVLFRANIYGKEGGIFIFIQFKTNSLEVDEFCKGYSVY